MSAASRKRVKAELAERATLAFSDVFNGVAASARNDLRGSFKHFALWHLQAFRRELESREASLAEMYPRARKRGGSCAPTT